MSKNTDNSKELTEIKEFFAKGKSVKIICFFLIVISVFCFTHLATYAARAPGTYRTIQLNTEYSDNLDTMYDLDVFEFTLKQPGKVYVDFSSDVSTKKYSWNILLRDEDGNIITDEYTEGYGNNDKVGVRTQFFRLPAGEYSVTIYKGPIGEFSNKKYKLTVKYTDESSKLTEKEWNDTIAEANKIDVNKSYLGNLYYAYNMDYEDFNISRNVDLFKTNDVDYYTFNLSKPGKLAIHFDRVDDKTYDKKKSEDENLSWNIQLIDKDENIIIDEYTKKLRDIVTTPVRVPSGKYYLKIYKGPEGNYFDMDYTFKVEYQEESPSRYEKEWNDTTASANKIDLNIAYTGNLLYTHDMDYAKYNISRNIDFLCSDDHDNYELNLTKATELYILFEHTDTTTKGASWNIQIKNENGNVMLDDCTSGWKSYYTSPVRLSPGKYCVVIYKGNEGVYSYKDYKFTVISDDTGKSSASEYQELIKPINGSTLGYSDLLVSWNKVSWAKNYKVTIEDLETSRYVFSKQLTDTSITIGDSYFKNWHQYKVWLAGINANGVQISLGNAVVWVKQDFREGDVSQQIIEIKKRLIGKGYDAGVINNKFDSVLKKAVNEFKTDNGLFNTGDYYGVIARDTWNALTDGVWLANGDRDEKVAQLQKMLISLGFTDVGEPDGIFGEKTLNAINYYKNQKKIYNTGEMAGVVGDIVWNLLVKESTAADLGRQIEAKAKNAADYLMSLVNEGKASLFYSTVINNKRYEIYRVTGSYIIESETSPKGFKLTPHPKYKASEIGSVKNHGYYFVDTATNALVTDTAIIEKLECMQNANFAFLLNTQIKKANGDPFALVLNDIKHTREIRGNLDFWRDYCDVCSSLCGKVAANYFTAGTALSNVPGDAIDILLDIAKKKVDVKTQIHNICVGTFDRCEDYISSLKSLHESYERKWGINLNSPTLFNRGYIDNYNDAKFYLECNAYDMIYYITSRFDESFGGYVEDYGWGKYLGDIVTSTFDSLVSKGLDSKGLQVIEKRIFLFYDTIRKTQNIFEAFSVFDLPLTDGYSKEIIKHLNNSAALMNPDYFNSSTYKLIFDGD